MDPADLRARFPILSKLTYLNTGTTGPLPTAAAEAAQAQIAREVTEGRTTAHWERRQARAVELRAAFAALLGATPDDVALTTSTSEGVATAISGFQLHAGDEILTSDTEHPGVTGPLIAAREIRGATLRAVPLAHIDEAVAPTTKLVVCSHVSWVTGEFAPPGLRDLAIPVILDGAQGVGAVPLDVRDLGCAAYAGSGQKWLCGPEGTGMLYVAPEWRERIASPHPSYVNLSEPNEGLASGFHADARRYDAPSLPASSIESVLASTATLAEFGWTKVHARGARQAAMLADMLRERGHDVVERDLTTLVAWRDEDAEETKKRVAEQGIVIRDLPGRGLVRASVGAWNDESDLERLVAALSA